MPETVLDINGVRICTEDFGAPAHPPILLIMGAAASMVWWPEAFCRSLAEGGRYVIRYDQRDTGRSTAYEPGKPVYSLHDLAADAIAILHNRRIDRAHLAGMSLGGMVAQIAAHLLERLRSG